MSTRIHPKSDHRQVPLAAQAAEAPWVSLVLATVGRYSEVEAFLISLAGQTYRRFDVVLVDQNEDERLRPLVNSFRRHMPIEWVRSAVGLSRARNLGLQYCRGDVVAFPDDDCTYPPQLLAQVAHALSHDTTSAGVSVLPCNAGGRPFPRYDNVVGELTQTNIFRRCTSISLFLRMSVIHSTGEFNERLGLGAGTLWGSGEDIDFPLRAIQAGHRISYRPDIHVTHPFDIRDETREAAGQRGYSYGAGVGWILRRHRFPLRVAMHYIFFRPLGGIVLGALRGRWIEASFYAATLRGRLRGWLSA